MRVLLSGGGTAGHIYPALSVAAELALDERSDVLFVGTPDGLEARLAQKAGLAYHALPSRGFDRGSKLSFIPAALTTLVSVVRAFALIGRLHPDVVVGFGGYVSLPLGLAAIMRGVPVVLHEQNSVPGLANRVLSRWACAIGVTYETSIQHLVHPDRAVLTGNPVRSAVLGSSREGGRVALDLAEDDLVLLVFGGSRGARHINQAVVGLSERLMRIPSLIVLHVAGHAEADDVRERLAAAGGDPSRYRVLDYIDDMGSAIAAADLVLSRAGATSIAEITVLGRPAVLVPYPYATDDHQTLNAHAVEQAGGARVVTDATLEEEGFAQLLLELLNDRAAREKIASASAVLGRCDAAERVADITRRYATGRRTEYVW